MGQIEPTEKLRNNKMSKPRALTGVTKAFQDWLSQRNVVNHARFETKYAPRSAPPAKMPKGTSHLMSENAYWARDGRRMSEPAVLVYNQGPKQIEAGESGATKFKVPQPGKVYHYSTTGTSD